MSGTKNTEDHILLTVPEVAERLRMSVRSVYQRIASGDIRRIKLGNRTTRIETSEVDRFLRQARRAAGHQGGE